jgi:hypothetical protein
MLDNRVEAVGRDRMILAVRGDNIGLEAKE